MDCSPDNWLLVAPFQTSLEMEPFEAFKLQVSVLEPISKLLKCSQRPLFFIQIVCPFPT